MFYSHAGRHNEERRVGGGRWEVGGGVSLAKREGLDSLTDGSLVIRVWSVALLTDVRVKERTLHQM